jgi:elongator complex protein 6
MALQQVHATIMTLQADNPLVAVQTTTLEREHAGLTLSLAHEAEVVIGLRLLDTGAADDVSGVVRITKGGGLLGRELEEQEYLYHVLGDGSVKVFNRGQ